MASAAQVVALARGEVGYSEQKNNITKYGQWYGLDGNPWCAMFVSFIFWSAGLPLPAQTRKGFAWCPAGVQWFRAMGLWTPTGRGRFYPGDVAFFQFDRDANADHVGIVVETKPKSIVCVEGNTSSGARGSQSDGGGVHVRERQLSLVLGVGRPLYSPAAPTPQPALSKQPAWPGHVLALTTPLTKSADVKTLQRRMVGFGSKLTVDGVYGRETYDNVRWWQAVKALHVDGVVGRETWAAFFA